MNKIYKRKRKIKVRNRKLKEEKKTIYNNNHNKLVFKKLLHNIKNKDKILIHKTKYQIPNKMKKNLQEKCYYR